MTLIHLINTLVAKRDALDADIKVLRKYTETLATAKKIAKTVKRQMPKSHWTQTPAGRLKMSRQIKKMWARKRQEAA